MKIIFLSNYFNHHQRPLSDAIYSLLDGQYVFIETQEMDEERKKMGWSFREYPQYVIRNEEFQKNKDRIQKKIDEADVVIIGSAPDELINTRKKHKKLVLRYSERPLKKGLEPLKFLPRFIKWRLRGVDKKNIYMLCGSSYTAADYSRFGLFKDKCFKWGYFPKTKTYENIGSIIESKKHGSILWVARLINWKHPECAIEVARRLKAEGYSFEMNIIGNGELENQLRDAIDEHDLSDCVHMLGAMSPEEVRQYMEQSEIFLFTSDRNEGWGAVLNESMNSACTVVASHAIGSVPFLIKDKVNGFIYKDGDIEDFFVKTKWLLDHPKERKIMSKEAYYTIAKEWNAESAARNLISLVNAILNENKSPELFDDGVCSRAEIIEDNWYGKE